jgi:ATPase subunit of ABC transporter with duplicated ATPase domains
MITTHELTINFGQRVLFEDVNVKFTPGNCYGVIGANGAGKSTLLRILAGEVDGHTGKVAIPRGLRMSVLRQDHFAFNDVEALTTVLMGHARLFAIMQEKDALYAKPDFSEEDGVRTGELEAEFADLDGWNAEPQAAILLSGLGLHVEDHAKLMKDLDDSQKVRVLLAQALFADPDILLLDEPTNHLDVDSILWLEEFLINFKNTVLVVSHDRHFLNKVCTHIADIDFKKVSIYTGNYDFWQQMSELALRQRRDQTKKAEDKAEELKQFISRFSANASKSRQATARKKLLDKLDLEKIPPSTRKYPHIVFEPEKVLSNEVLTVKGLSKEANGVTLFKDVSFRISRGEKVVLVADDGLVTTALLDILAGGQPPDAGAFSWSKQVQCGYFPKEYAHLFETNLDLVDWLRQFSGNQEEGFVRTFLGRMLFSGDESKKSVNVLSGGERVRCMLSKLMLENPQVMLLDGPTNHLDLESITALNDSLKKYKGTLLFASHDVEFIESLADRVLEIRDGKLIDRPISFADYLEERAALKGITNVA